MANIYNTRNLTNVKPADAPQSGSGLDICSISSQSKVIHVSGMLVSATPESCFLDARILNVAYLALLYILTPVLRKIITGLKLGIIFLCLSMFLSSTSLLFVINVFAEKIAGAGQCETYFHIGLILHQLPIKTIGVILYYVERKIRAGQLNCWKVLLESGIITMLFSGVFSYYV